MDKKYRESFVMCGRGTERNSWTDRAISEMLQKVEEGHKFLRAVNQRKCNWTGQISYSNCRLKRVIEDKIEGTGRRGRGCKQLLDGIKER
jgi:hypothetical protein